jgi:cytochrome c biogenesis factor
MNDSLLHHQDTIRVTKVIIDTIRSSSKDSMELIYKVDAFYNNSWSKLVLGITIVFSIIGIVIPLYIQYYQKKILKLNEEKLRADIKNETEKALTELQKNFETTTEIRLHKLRTEIYGCLYHVQGVQMSIQNLNPKAVRDFSKAILRYIEASDTINDHNALNNIENAFSGLKITLKKCDKKSVDECYKK